jgi:hypothetical protein
MLHLALSILLWWLPQNQSVKEFGIIGDGTADDTAAFQKLPRGRTLFVPAGRYRIVGDATLPEDLSLELAEGAIFDIRRSLTINGQLLATLSQHFTGPGSAHINGGKNPSVYPQWWEKTSTGIQSAVNAIVGTGGTVRFPTDLYRHSSTVVVSSPYPINLIGEMQGMMDDRSQAKYGIALSADLDGPMFLYTAPDINHRNIHGGGRISGLAFIDPDIRKHRASAILQLNDFTLSIVTNNLFQWIQAPAIIGQFLVQSEISSNAIRYCGNGTSAVVALPSDDPMRPAQSLKIDGNRLEVNHGAYLELGQNAMDVGVIDNRFEAETMDVPTNQPFIIQHGSSSRFIGNTFNRNTGTQFEILQSATANVISGNTFRGGAFPKTALKIDGYANAITGNTFASTRTGIEVDLTGPYNTFSGNSLYWSGSIRATGRSNVITGNVLFKLSATTAVLGEGRDFWIDARSSVGTVVASNTLDNNTGTVTTVGGILAGEQQTVNGNSVRNFSGTGSGAIGISTK